MYTILIPTDFSNNARIATEYALKLFNGPETHFILLSTFHPEHAAGMLMPVPDHIHEDILLSLNKEVARIEKELGHATDNIEVCAVHGALSNVVENIVEQRGIDLVVMGTKGDGAIKNLLIGSNTWHVINQADCPVLAVPENAIVKLPEQILFASDGKYLNNISVTDPLRMLASKSGASIKILHVLVGEPLDQIYYDNLQRTWNEYFDGIEHHLFYEVSDDVPAAVEKFIQENQTDIIALIPSENNLFNKLFHKSITKDMVLHSDIPLLAINGSFNK